MMERTQLNIRIKREELVEWVERAAAEGMSLSAWIRERCNAGGKDNTDVPRMARIPAVGRRVDAHERAMDIAKGLEAAVDPEHDPVVCEHGAEFGRCKKWGCKFYEVANGRR